MPSPTPDDVRVSVDRALARLAPEAAAEAPRAMAVALALAEGISAEAALARCGVEVPPARPDWSEEPFECLIFTVAGLQLAVPLELHLSVRLSVVLPVRVPLGCRELVSRYNCM